MGLASDRFDTPVRREEYPIPPNVDEIVESIRDILNGGSVKGLTIVQGDGIRVYRASPDAEYDPSFVVDNVLGYADVYEYLTDETHSANDKVVGMAKVLSQHRCFPVCFATGPKTTGLLDRWLMVEEVGLPRDIENIIGIPVVRVKTLDEDTLLLCGADMPLADLEDIKVVVKTAIDLRGKEYEHYRASTGSSARSSAPGPVRPDSEGDDSAAHQVGPSPGGSGGLGGIPTGVFGR